VGLAAGVVRRFDCGAHIDADRIREREVLGSRRRTCDWFWFCEARQDHRPSQCQHEPGDGRSGEARSRRITQEEEAEDGGQEGLSAGSHRCRGRD